MEGLSHDDDLLTTELFLMIWIPNTEDVSNVREQNTIIFGFSLLENLEELDSNLRFGWDASVGGTSKD